jgi:hypothetical protein
MASAAEHGPLEPHALLALYLEEKQVRNVMDPCILLGVRANPTSREVALISRKHMLDLHPDKGHLDMWLNEFHKDVTDQTAEATKELLKAVSARFLAAREQLTSLDQALFKQAPLCVCVCVPIRNTYMHATHTTTTTP